MSGVGEKLRRRRGLIFAIPAGALAVLVIVAAINFDQGSAAKRESRIKDAQALLAPKQASADELRNAAGSLSEQTAIRLTDGAWVQVADQTGRLAQQYSAVRLEPLPDSRLRMTEPRARMFLKDGRVLSMASKAGLVHVPHRALESGALEGEVEIRLFKPVDGREVDVLRDKAAIVITADQAQFDGTAGEVRCDRAVRIETDAGSFAGQGLTLVLDADGEGVESLVVDRALEPIRIDRASRAVAARRRDPRATIANQGVDAASPAGAAPQKDAEPTRFYRLVLMGGVEVVRTRDGVASTIRGEELVAVFSLESQGLDQFALVPAGGDRPFQHGPTMISSSFAAPPALAIGALAFAAQQVPSVPAPSSGASDSVVVTFGGRMEMVPVTDPADRLASRDDIRFDVLGPRVELLDGRSASRIACSRLRYSVRDERVEAEGRAGVPLTVVNPRMALEAVRFTASFSEGVGRLEGPGRMAFARGAGREVSWFELAPSITTDVSRMLVSADPAAVALVVDPPKKKVDPAAVRFDPAEQELEITWKGGVDLRFAGGGDNAKISGAKFDGGVDVLGRQFELGSQSLEVAFSPKDSERIDAIIADGGTHVRQLGAAGAMNAERLELFLTANRKGDSIPSKLVARKAVEAKDGKQTIWTEDLVVTFAEKRAEATQAAQNGATTAVAGAAQMGDIDVDSVEAKGGVQVLLGGGRGDGARVFADTLAGNALERKLRLTGENVAIVRSNIIADNLRDLRFDDATHSARSEGPGRFRSFKKPIALGDGRIERPNPDAVAALDASWTGSLDYREASAEKGTLDIRGGVKLRSRSNEKSTDAVDANSVVIDLGLAAGAEAGKPDAERVPEHFLARGDARIESRAWKDAEHTGEPRLFRVNGDHIEYDMKSREGLVVGQGGLLVNMPADSAARKNASGAVPIALGSEGTTRFTWKQRMALERVVDDRYRIRMDDGVELLHAGAREQDRMTMRCDAIEAAVRRPDESGEKSASGGVDLGGPAELLAVKGTGNVFIRTPTQDLECGEFDYSVQSGIATLKGREGRAVTVVLANQPTPIQAQEILWDLREGRLEIKKPLVTGVR